MKCDDNWPLLLNKLHILDNVGSYFEKYSGENTFHTCSIMYENTPEPKWS